MNYAKSEGYRLLRKKGLYGIFLTSLTLVIAAIGALYFSSKSDPNFPYGSNRFLYLNVITVCPLIVVVGMLLNRQLLGNDTPVIKQIISFGIRRKQVYLTKLGLTALSFLLLCGIGLAIVYVGGNLLPSRDAVWHTQFLLAIANIIPLVIGGFVLGHTLFLLFSNEMYAVFVVLLLFSGLPANLIKMIFGDSNFIAILLPGSILKQIIENYVAQQGMLLTNSILVGSVLTIGSLIFGLKLFDKKAI